MRSVRELTHDQLKLVVDPLLWRLRERTVRPCPGHGADNDDKGGEDEERDHEVHERTDSCGWLASMLIVLIFSRLGRPYLKRSAP